MVFLYAHIQNLDGFHSPQEDLISENLKVAQEALDGITIILSTIGYDTMLTSSVTHEGEMFPIVRYGYLYSNIGTFSIFSYPKHLIFPTSFSYCPYFFPVLRC